MLKKILAAVAALALGAGFVVATGFASADAAAVAGPPDGQCVVNVIHHPAVAEVWHPESRYVHVIASVTEVHHTEWRYQTRVQRPDNTVERKFVEGYDFVAGGSVTFNDSTGHSQTVSGHWVVSAGWHQIPDSVINAYWGSGGITASLLGGSEANPKGPVPLSVYGGPNVNVSYYASQVTISGGYTDWGPFSDWSTTDPGSSTLILNVESRVVIDTQGVTGGTYYYLTGGGTSSTLTNANWTTDTPAAPWTLIDTRKVVDTAATDAWDENVYGACPSDPCVSSSSTWFTEDVAPTQESDGLHFTGPEALAVDWYHQVTGNIEGTVGSSYTITSAGGYHAALVYEFHRQGLAAPDFSDYATLSIEPYLNGWAPGQTGTFTVTHSTLVWTSKITSGLGSQADPATIDEMSAIFPANTLITQGLHLGTNSVAGQFTVVSAVTGCGDVSFVPFDPPTLADFPTNLTSTNEVCTAGTITSGTITVGVVGGVNFFTGEVDYFLDGSATPMTAQTVRVAAGIHTVTASPHDSADTLDGDTAWTVPIAAAGLCPTDLKTLALTGTPSPASGVLLSLLLLGAGMALMVARRVRHRREA